MTAATYAQLGQIATQPDFQSRVAIAMNSSAVSIYSEAFTANASTAAGNAVLHFAATTGIAAGQPVNNLTTPASIPAGTTVLSVTATTVTISANAAGSGVAIGDSIAFVNGHAARASYATKVMTGNYALYAACLGVLVNSTIQGEANPNVVGNAIPDTDIQFQVNSIWNALAGA